MTTTNDGGRVLAWHFLKGPLPGILRDGSPAPADGEILRHEGALRLCESGLHASIRAEYLETGREETRAAARAAARDAAWAAQNVDLESALMALSPGGEP